MIALLAFIWWVVVPLAAVSWAVAVEGMLSAEPRVGVIVFASVLPTVLLVGLLGVLVIVSTAC